MDRIWMEIRVVKEQQASDFESVMAEFARIRDNFSSGFKRLEEQISLYSKHANSRVDLLEDGLHILEKRMDQAS